MRSLEDIHKIITPQRLIAEGTPSASIAVLTAGKISATVITKGLENTKTVYQAASISKAITALAVAKLSDDGHFSYESCVAEHIPPRYISAIAPPSDALFLEKVTVGALLSHTAGLSQGGFRGYTSVTPETEDILAGRAPSNSPQVHFETFPGARYQYSGGGFMLLQVFLESVMEMSFPALMQKVVPKQQQLTAELLFLHPADTLSYWSLD